MSYNTNAQILKILTSSNPCIKLQNHLFVPYEQKSLEIPLLLGFQDFLFF